MAGPPLDFLDIPWFDVGERRGPHRLFHLETGIKLTKPNEPDNDCFSL
jgi:hypothetical protein